MSEELFNFILEEPKLVEVDAETDVQVVLLEEILVGSGTVAVLHAYVNKSLGLKCGKTETKSDTIFSYVAGTCHDVVTIIETSDTICDAAEIVATHGMCVRSTERALITIGKPCTFEVGKLEFSLYSMADR